jgi:hypothetical protein
MSLMQGKMTKWDTNLVNFPVLMLMSMTLVLSGCATPFFGGYGAKGQSREEFTRYVEGVFRLQNSMTSEIMALLETDDAKNHDVLLQAEQQMQEACGPLNEYVSRESDGLNIGFFLSRRVEKSAIDCEQAAQKVNSLFRP